MENDIARQFTYIELDYLKFNEGMKETIKKIYDNPDINDEEIRSIVLDKWNKTNKTITIDKKPYNRVVLTPLVMDFGYKGFTNKNDYKGIEYKLRPRKSVVSQTNDLFAGIQSYYESSKGMDLIEIYPFLGLNPRNYKNVGEIKKLLKKYFNGFKNDTTPDERQNNLKERKKKFLKSKEDYIEYRNKNKSEEEEIEIRTLLDSSLFYFAGIKLYPPLGFNPWPEGECGCDKLKDKKNTSCEYCKAQEIYKFSKDNNVPLTIHCSDGGYQIMDKTTHELFTEPEKWKKVLDSYNDLKINLAHSGVQMHKSKKQPWGEWLNYILNRISEEKNYKNLYIDLADIGEENCSYESFCTAVSLFIQNKEGIDVDKFLDKLNKRILFGTDFMVNLFNLDSYHQHIEKFAKTNAFNKIEIDKQKTLQLDKTKFCTTNSETFLFGEKS